MPWQSPVSAAYMLIVWHCEACIPNTQTADSAKAGIERITRVALCLALLADMLVAAVPAKPGDMSSSSELHSISSADSLSCKPTASHSRLHV